MEDPTLDQVRNVKSEILARFKDLQEFAGVGIGENDGRPCIRVNWRVLPKNLPLPSSIGDVEITHHEIGSVSPQSE